MRGSIHIINSAADAERAGLSQADIVQAATLSVTIAETTSATTDGVTPSDTDVLATDNFPESTLKNNTKSTTKKLLEKLKIKKADSEIHVSVDTAVLTNSTDLVDRKERKIDQGTLERLGVKAL